MKKEVFSPKSKEELLSEFRSKWPKRWEKRTGSSVKFVFFVFKKSSWSRTTLDCTIMGKLYSHNLGTVVSFRIIPGPSSVVSFLLCLLCLGSSIIRTLILKSYVVELYAYEFLGIVSIFSVLLLLQYFYRVKETRASFLELLLGTRGS